MKRNPKIYFVVIAALLMGLVACEQFDKLSGIGEMETVKATIKVALELESDIPAPQEMAVKLVNFAERYELNTTVSANGTVTVDNVIPGIYTVTVSGENNEDGFTYNYNGNAVNVDITKDATTVDVKVGGSKSGALLFKEVYYCGSR